MRRIRVIPRCHGVCPTVRPLPPPPVRPLLSNFPPTSSSAAAYAGTFSNSERSGEIRPLTHHHYAEVSRLSSTTGQQRSLSPLPPSKPFPRRFRRGGHDSAPSSVVCGGSSGPIARSTRSTSSQGKETPGQLESSVTSAASSSMCNGNGFSHQRDSISHEAHLVLKKSRARSSSRMTPADLSVPDDMSLGERRWVVEKLLEERDWEGTERALEGIMAVPSIISLPEGRKVLGDLAKAGLRACAEGKDSVAAGEFAGKLLRWLDGVQDAVALDQQDLFHAIEATSASPSCHAAAEWALREAVLRGYRPTTGHFLTAFECLAAAENWVGISKLFDMMVNVGKGQIPSPGALKAAIPGLVWQWRPDEVLEISRRTVEWSSMDAQQLREKGARMLSDLVSAYAAAGNRLPPSRPDMDVHFVPLPVRGLMAVLRLWETWLGEHTFTDEALVEAMSACNTGGHFDHTLALLDAVARRAQGTLSSSNGSKDPKVTHGLSSDSTGPDAGDAKKKGVADVRGRLSPPPEVFTLALEACAGRVRQSKAANAEPLSKQIILLMQALGVEKDASVYAGLIACCRGNVSQAKAHLSQMEEEGHGYTARAVNAAMRVCINSGELQTALALAKRLPVAEWDGQTVRLMSICHERKQQTGSLIRIVQRLQEREREGNPIFLPHVEDYARLAKAAHKAHGQRRKPWEVLELCISGGLVPNEEVLLTVSEACVQGRLWRQGAACLDVGVKSGVGRECLRQLAQHAYEACAAGRMWEELKQVRILMAEWEMEPTKHTRARVYELAREQQKELRQETNSGDSSSAPERLNAQGEGRMRAGDLGKESTGFRNDCIEYDPGPEKTNLAASVGVTLAGDAVASTGLGSAADAIGQAGVVGIDVDVGVGGVRTGTKTGSDKGDGDRKRRKGKKWRPSTIPEDPLGPLSPPEEWWEGQIPPRRSVEEGSGKEQRGLLEAVRWLEVKVGGGLGWESAGDPVESEESIGSRLTLERWSHFLPANGEDPVKSSRDGGRD